MHTEQAQKLEEPFEHAFERLKLTEKQKLYFKDEWTFTGKRDFIKRYVFTEPWRYVLKTEPNMITKIKVIDPLLLQQEAEIVNYLERNDLQPKLNKLLDGYHQYRWNFDPKPKYKHILKPRSAKQLNGRQHNELENE